MRLMQARQSNLILTRLGVSQLVIILEKKNLLCEGNLVVRK